MEMLPIIKIDSLKLK